MEEWSWIEEFGRRTERTELGKDPGAFPTFDQFIETCRGGWGPAGTCSSCGEAADRLTADADYCFACEKYHYGHDRGEYLALFRVGQHFRAAFMPMISWWPGQWPPKEEASRSDPPPPWSPPPGEDKASQ
jgi:hypothetical protein